MTTEQNADTDAAPKVETPDEAAEDSAAIWQEMDEADAAGKPLDSDKEPGREVADDFSEDADPNLDTPTEPDADAPGKEEERTDIWANAPPELVAAHEALKAENDKVLHTVRSDKGRQAALQRQIAELKKPKPTAEQAVKDAGKVKEDDDALKTFQEEYPEVAGPIMTLIDRQGAEIERLNGAVGGMAETQNAGYAEEQEAIVVAAHPDYDVITKMPEFRKWYDNAPTFMQEGVQRNGQTIIDGAEVAKIMSYFKADTGIGTPAKPAAQPKPNAKRRSQLEASGTPSPRGPGAVNTIPDDAEGAWKYFEQQDAREARNRA